MTIEPISLTYRPVIDFSTVGSLDGESQMLYVDIIKKCQCHMSLLLNVNVKFKKRP